MPPSSRKVFAAEDIETVDQIIYQSMKNNTSTSEKRSSMSALKPSTRSSSRGGGGGGGGGGGSDSDRRAVSFSGDSGENKLIDEKEQQQQESPQKNENDNTGAPNNDSSPRRSSSSFMKNNKNNSPKNKGKGNNTKNYSGKENNNNKATDESGSTTHRKSSSWSSGLRFGKRFSLFGSSGRYGTLDESNNNNNNNNNDEDVDYPTAAEVDPVMTIFESRNTQRVRFTLGNDGGGDSVISGDVSGDDNTTVGGGDNNTSVAKNGGENCNNNNSNGGNNSAGNIKQFMSRALFGSSSKSGSPSNKKLSEEEMKQEVKELGGGSLIWESTATPTGPEVIHTKNNASSKNRESNNNNNSNQQTSTTPELLLSFTEDPKARVAVAKLLSKARKAEHIHFRYEYAVKCYLKALNILQKQAKYPDNHPTVVKTVRLMNNAHHVLSSYNNSANIVKMGIKNEDAGELVKALKMYTIAYRIRRDNLSRNHPSLVVLLNMLGSIQIKRGETKEAMQIYELALNDDLIMSRVGVSSNSEGRVQKETIDPEKNAIHQNLLAKSVTFREMGTIYEMWGNVEESLKFYHRSLECVAEWRETVRSNRKKESSLLPAIRSDAEEDQHYSIENVQTISSSAGDRTSSGSSLEHGEMELVYGADVSQNNNGSGSKSVNVYERFFPNKMDAETKEGLQGSDENSHADMDLSLTLHQIAQLYRTQGKFNRALDAYEVALRGMKTALGKHHPNVAAVLGNIGNLQKEMGDLDAAYKTYQEVLGIESYRLGLSHPDVAITLHNIATIDAARGNYEHSLSLYRKVIGLQKKLFGEENLAVSVTAACMGDVYEKIGDLKSSMTSYDEAVRIKSAVVGRHSLEVGRLLHKLGKLSFIICDYLEAESFIARTVLIYRLNKLDEGHEWFVDAYRDSADIDGAIAMGTDRGEI
jgi:tetratricopeptide (TPR) repeat protein